MFIDNQASLDMIAVKPLNILALIDEESKFPKVRISRNQCSMLVSLISSHLNGQFITTRTTCELARSTLI